METPKDKFHLWLEKETESSYSEGDFVMLSKILNEYEKYLKENKVVEFTGTAHNLGQYINEVQGTKLVNLPLSNLLLRDWDGKHLKDKQDYVITVWKGPVK